MDLNALSTNIHKEHDACGIYSRIEKAGQPTHQNVQSGIRALNAMRHRAGYVQGEGDGCGILVDIPQTLWREQLYRSGLDGDVVYDPHFFVGHLFVSEELLGGLLAWCETGLPQTNGSRVELLLVKTDGTDEDALGPLATQEALRFVQICGLTEGVSEDALFALWVELEEKQGVHVASLSRHSVVYKVIGNDETLYSHYLDLQNPLCQSRFVLAHTRFSTNTATSCRRVQPFGVLGHNGEINTATRLFSEASMIGATLDPHFSDSQMVDGLLRFLTDRVGLSLFESMEMVFPPILHEIKQMKGDFADMYMFLRALWGPFAQGPAGVMTRSGNEAVFSVDALGLRPMWLVETVDGFVFASEHGLVPPEEWVRDPKPLAPGEKIGIQLNADGARRFDYPELQREVHKRFCQRFQFKGESMNIHFSGPYFKERDASPTRRIDKPLVIRAQAFGWREDDVRMLEHEVQTATEPIRSLGYDGPLAAMDRNLRLLPDFLHETVAVVTNPAIDREREIEHFSTRTLLGRRPSFTREAERVSRIELSSPLLFERIPKELGVPGDELEAVAQRNGTLMFEDALSALHDSIHGTVEILVHRKDGEGIQSAIRRFEHEARNAIDAGANVIVLDDRLQFSHGHHIDAYLVLAAVHKALLVPSTECGGEYIRRRTSIVLRSGAIRNLHDIMTAIGLGADAISPYLMWEFAAQKGSLQGIENLYHALCKGIEKVLSTIGIHEVRGYERLFSAIGLHDDIADIFGVPNFCGSTGRGYGFVDLELDAEARQALFDSDDVKGALRRKTFQLYPRIWKTAAAVAAGELSYDEYFAKLDGFERDNPTSLRHLLGFSASNAEHEQTSSGDWNTVDTSIDGHAMPLVISSMSFGSQGETAYRAYASAAHRLNIVALNGEGGEIKDMLGQFPRNRGRQVASGRFGINAEVVNGVYVIEIKIGQGAKPGEGGHLPGSKVTAQVAAARNASTGVDLISPSNNHDIYSIEDLAQVIYELKQVNPSAKIAVKVPVVPNIGTIAVGIVKAGADIVNLSGFDGGTGAARGHAIRHVGLPVEIGIRLTHDALCSAGLRSACEVWSDGGMKSGADVMKAILLGANRVGFGTMAMVAIGCTACRACHKDTCHVGIATQMTDVEEALLKGVTSFSPRELDIAVDHLVRFFHAVGTHIQQLTGQLGAQKTQDLVGRRDLLAQLTSHANVDVSWLLESDLSVAGGVSYEMAMQSEQQTAYSETFVGLMTGSGDVSHYVESFDSKAHDLTPGFPSTEGILTPPRGLGNHESGEMVRTRGHLKRHVTDFPGVTGNGFASYHSVGMVSIAHGGAQDGVGKNAHGGRILVLKHRDASGQVRGGSVGKGLAYGAQRGLFIVQGCADARAGIRLSGADIVIGGEVEGKLDDSLGCIAARASIKGFAFEYMTAGRAIVLGDPGPWICSGMTGGRVYLRHDPSVGLTEQALRRRIAKGAKVTLRFLDPQGARDVVELLKTYQRELRRAGHSDTSNQLVPLIRQPGEHFFMIVPGAGITDQSIATE